jgi:hypothetical protein
VNRLPTANPFLSDVCTTPFEVVEGRSVGALNRDVVQQVAGALEELAAKPGKPLLLLTAPRAGYGKTHLLGRVAAATGDQAVAMPLVFRSDSEVTWTGISFEAVEILRRLPGHYQEWSRLRETCAGIFATLVLRLIKTGKLPCANRDQAMRVLSLDPTELFRDGTPAKLIGDWLRKHFGQLRHPLAELARDIPGSGVMDGWMDALFACAHHGTPASMDTVVQLATGSREAFLLWLRLVALWRPAVLFVDHLDGFYRMEKAGLRIATILLELAGQEGVHVVLSLNQDVWQATFAHHLPSALEDRLTASQFLLRGLSAREATELVRLRLQGAGISDAEAEKFERFIHIPRYFEGRPVGSVSARAFLRHLAQHWETFADLRARGQEPSESTLIDSPAAEESSESLGDALPSLGLFGAEDASFVRTAAASLAEPKPEMVDTPFSALPSAFVPVGLAEPTSPFFAAEQPPEAAPVSPPPLAPATQPNGPEALERLRDMMDRLRAKSAEPAAPAPVVEPPPVSPITAKLTSVLNQDTVSAGRTDDLLGRFEALRMQLTAEAEHRPLDLGKLGELIRLAGKRFPLVRFDEVELASLPGKTAPRWSLQGQEILFGVADFQDRNYWRALARHVSERLSSGSESERPSQVKLVAFKSDRETLVWTALHGGDVFPDNVRSVVEALHLDTRSIAALYAMQRMIAEAECGQLSATPSQVMSVLARELDFFWKRVTRPVAMSR